ncbi:hypothetical protein HZS_215 [Henneguya salminicola]|nr:hypothetical protein HZS_215 [Henneguya salminicola]
MIGMVKDYLSISGLHKKCYMISKGCNKCLENKTFNPHKGKVEGGLYSKKPFEIISTDIVGPYEGRHFSNAPADKIWILTISDICTRYSLATSLLKPDAEHICASLKKYWFSNYELPIKIISDQGRPYMSKTYRNLLKKHGIRPSYTTTYNPTGNGISERINSTISATLRIYKGKSWEQALEKVNLRLNCGFHRILKASPFELKNNYSPLDPLMRNYCKSKIS